MKSWTVDELRNVVTALGPIKGLRLQEVQTSPEDVVLGFYSAQGLLWLWLDFNATTPCLLPWTKLPCRVSPVRKTPLNLFIRAHFLNRILREVRLSEELGRVVYLDFSLPEDPHPAQLEVLLFPHGRNLLARADGKQVSWQKPKEAATAPVHMTSSFIRSLEELRDEWLNKKTKGRGGARAPKDLKSKLESDLVKKQKVLAKVSEELLRKQESPWREVGDWLKTHQSLNVRKEWEPFVDKRRKLSWNIEQCFLKARENDGKALGTERRQAQLQKEVAELQAKLAGPLQESAPTQVPAKPKVSLEKMEAKGRTLRLSEDLTALAGKSAIDNMKILRRARAWDLWFHLRDFPASHGILLRNKNALVTDQQLYEVAGWLVRLHLGNKVQQHSGEKFDVVVTERRHVHPIKGDKLGRVHYHHERVLIFQLPT